MIRRWLERSWVVWRGVSAAGALFLSLLALFLLVSGTVPPARVKDAARALAGKGRAALPPPPGAPGQAEWKRLAETQRQGEAVLRKRRAEVEKLDAVASARLSALEAERRRLEEERRAGEEESARLRQRLESLAAVEIDAEMQANLPIFSRMDGAAILARVKGWDDARLARYLRAMRPGKAAEVLEAMGLDPEFRPRADRVMEELKRPPGEGPK
jgi:septal ring factor EnvC (AmiA/AmiB activator)